jgi:hypothetical protein
MMLKDATTPEALAKYEQYLRKHKVNPGQALLTATAEQMRMIIEALRRPPVPRSTSQG